MNWHRVTTYYSNNNINDNLKITNSTRHTDNYNTEYVTPNEKELSEVREVE